MPHTIVITGTKTDDSLAITKYLERNYYSTLTAYSEDGVIPPIPDLERKLIIISADGLDCDINAMIDAFRSDQSAHYVPVFILSNTPLDEYTLRQVDEIIDGSIHERLLITRVSHLIAEKKRAKALSSQVSDISGADIGELTQHKRFPSRRVLVVTEDAKTAKTIEGGLRESLDVVVNTVRSEHQASLLLDQSHQDVLIVDLQLAGESNGVRLLAQTRRAKPSTEVRCIAIYKRGAVKKMLATLDFGIDDAIRTPIDTAELVVRVRTQLRQKIFSEGAEKDIQEAVRRSVIDPLTSAYNRRHFENFFYKLSEKALTSGTRYSVAILDLDNFKAINDTFGHDGGDVVLIEFYNRLSRSLRAADFIARIGGEEFALLLPETNHKEAKQVAARICHDIASEKFSPNRDSKVKVTTSIGVCTPDINDANLTAILGSADRALYLAKRSGRNQYKSSEDC